MKYVKKNKMSACGITKKVKVTKIKKVKTVTEPSFHAALKHEQKESTKFFGDEGKEEQSDQMAKKGKKGSKKGMGSATFGNKAANLGAYVV
jgi:hypothetical protein